MKICYNNIKITLKYGGNNIKMKKDVSQPLRLPEILVKEVDELSKKLNMSKNDIFKIGIMLAIKQLKEV